MYVTTIKGKEARSHEFERGGVGWGYMPAVRRRK